MPNIWTCKIGEKFHRNLPSGADAPMRNAVRKAYLELTGEEPDFIFSGWGGSLTKGERTVIDATNRPRLKVPDVPKGGERIFEAGFVLRNEAYDLGADNAYMVSAYTPSGDYIGSYEDAVRLIVKKGIRPQRRTPDSNVCSIGYQPNEQKWYGWSHRAIYGFGVGDVVKDGDCTADGLPVGFTAKNLADAKKMAEAFAESVS